jgi:hypothetical protein
MDSNVKVFESTSLTDIEKQINEFADSNKNGQDFNITSVTHNIKETSNSWYHSVIIVYVIT